MTALVARVQLPRAAGFTLDVDLELPAAGITGVFGASGSGKTTLLRCVAGLERAARAHIALGATLWQDERAFVPPWRREVGYVFQDAALFDHLDVRGNLRYGLRRTRDAQPHALDAAVDLLGIATLLPRRPASLSGGERQRVAIARAIATSPKLLLLDEPLASLDRPRRAEIFPWLERLRTDLRIPMLYVTHEPGEIARLADSVVVLDAGRAVACGAAAEVLAGVEGAAAFGEDAGALLTGRVAERDTRWHLARIDFDGGGLWLRDTGLAPGQAVRLRLLARDVSIATAPPEGTSIQNVIAGVVTSVSPDSHPSQVLVRLRCGGSVLLARITARAADALRLAPGMAVWAQVKSVAVVG